jgi:hypothetical protein
VLKLKIEIEENYLLKPVGLLGQKDPLQPPMASKALIDF